MSHMERFMRVYDEVQAYLLQHMSTRYSMDEARVRYLRDMMNVTCLGGKYNRGICVVQVAEAMLQQQHHHHSHDDSNKTAAQQGGGASNNNVVDDDTAARRERVLHDACVCGWMIEMLQAHFLVEDDIMDSSTTRRGKPCWYLHPGVTTQYAINDGLLLLAWTTHMATHFLADRACLPRVLRHFHEVTLTTCVGQFYDVTSMVDAARLDAHTGHPHTHDYADYTLAHYRRIVVHKTAYYTYWLPLVLGLLVSDAHDTVDAATLERVALLMGEYFQAQDDVMDCFTPPEKLGKVGTDIQEAKCSWLAVTFLSTATPAQREAFAAHYGKSDDADVQVIKRLYTEAALLERFAAYEADVAAEVAKLIDTLRAQSDAFAQSVQALWDKTYKRER